MRARDIIGRRVARVDQQRRADTNSGSAVQEMMRIVFVDGTILYFGVTETDHGDGYIVTGHTVRPTRNKK
jgi:hypothetical protein